MEANTVSTLWYRKVKPQGKVRRRVQDLRIPSSSYLDFSPDRSALDLSHNESARLAADTLLSQGLEGYQEVLKEEGEVDFLSEQEKSYFLENGKDRITEADSDAGDGSDSEFESLSTSSPSATQLPSVSKDSDPTETGSSSKEDVTDCPASVEADVKVFFYTEKRAAGLKDVVREFIRKATKALVIVTNHCSDPELLCDLLEASKKRFISVHLLLDHLNLDMFTDMCQELKLRGKDFSKFSVHSVDGQTYCAKTGKKLTGQISETFIIADWTEALTGSFSLSWLSWLVHRSLAFLIKGSSVTHFVHEFDRLSFCSKPVLGFSSVPLTIPIDITSSATNHEPKGKIRSDQTDVVRIWDWIEDGLNSHRKERTRLDIPQIKHRNSKPLRQPVMQHKSMEKFTQQTLGCNSVQDNLKMKADILQRQTQRNSQLKSQLIPYTRSQQNGTKNGLEVQGVTNVHSTLLAHRQDRAVVASTLNKDFNQDRPNVKLEEYWLQRQNRNTAMTPPGIAAGINKLRGERNISKSNTNFTQLNGHSNYEKQSPIKSTREPIYGVQTTVLTNGVKTQDQSQRYQLLQSQTTMRSPTTSTATIQKPDSKLFLPATVKKLTLEPHTSQQVKVAHRLSWLPQSNIERPRPMARLSSFNSTFDTVQKMDGHVGWRQFHGTTAKPLTRSKSMNERPATWLNLK